MFTKSLRTYDGKYEPESVGAMNIFRPMYLLLSIYILKATLKENEYKLKKWTVFQCSNLVTRFCINYSEKPWQKAKMRIQSCD